VRHPFVEVVLLEEDEEDEFRAKLPLKFFRCLDCGHLCFEKEVVEHECLKLELDQLAQRRR
jgi:hypothetical protein